LAPRLAAWPPLVVANQVAPFVLAVAGWVSLLPYLVWGQPRALMFGALAACAVAAVVFIAEPRTWDRIEIAGVALLAAFLILITLQIKLDGGHLKWVFVLPTLLALALLSTRQRSECLNAFINIFALSLIPGILVALYVAAGFPISFSTLVAPDGVRRLVFPGLLFIEPNRIELPWHGVLFRLCGMYDEPGMVGTIGALLLATLRFRVREWRALILYVAGLLSFSLAFALLAVIGILTRAFLLRRLWWMLAAVPILAAVALALGLLNVSIKGYSVSNITLSQSVGLVNKVTTTSRNMLRHQTANRSTAQMDKLIEEYFDSDISTLLFGIASDASVVRGAKAQIWMRILTDHGIVGLLLLGGGVGLIAWSAIRRTHALPWTLLFMALYAFSFYQRPVIWMPYTLLILFCAQPFIDALRERVSPLPSPVLRPRAAV
jgi:hypothetical protein